MSRLCKIRTRIISPCSIYTSNPSNSNDSERKRKNTPNTNLENNTSSSNASKKRKGPNGTVGENAHSDGSSNPAIGQEIDEWLSKYTQEEIFASDVYQELLAMANNFAANYSASQKESTTVYADPRVVAMDHDYCAVAAPEQNFGLVLMMVNCQQVYADPRVVAMDHDYCAVAAPEEKL